MYLKSVNSATTRNCHRTSRPPLLSPHFRRPPDLRRRTPTPSRRISHSISSTTESATCRTISTPGPPSLSIPSGFVPARYQAVDAIRPHASGSKILEALFWRFLLAHFALAERWSAPCGLISEDRPCQNTDELLLLVIVACSVGLRRYRLGVRTSGSQPENRGSIPRTATTFSIAAIASSRLAFPRPFSAPQSSCSPVPAAAMAGP